MELSDSDSFLKNIEEKGIEDSPGISNIYVQSVDGVIEIIQREMTALRDGEERNRLVQKCVLEELPGDRESFHRLTELLTGLNDYKSAFIICIAGRIRFHKYVELMADELILYRKMGPKYDGSALDLVKEIRRDVGLAAWSMHMFQAVFEYYFERLKDWREEILKEDLGNALQVTYDCQDQFPYHEEGYLWEAKCYCEVRRFDEAIRKLTGVLSYKQGSVRKKWVRCPECCMLLISLEQGNCNDYLYIRKMALKGKEYAITEEQRQYFDKILRYADRCLDTVALQTRDAYNRLDDDEDMLRNVELKEKTAVSQRNYIREQDRTQNQSGKRYHVKVRRKDNDR